MEEIIKQLIEIEKKENSISISLPILYYGGDNISIDVIYKNNLYTLSDVGGTVDCISAVAGPIPENFIKRHLKNIDCNFDKSVFSLNGLTESQLLGGITYFADELKRISENISESLIALSKDTMHNIIKQSLEKRFLNCYKDKVKENISIVGNSTKSHIISFCVLENKKLLIEPISNNFKSISSTFTKFYDIGLTKEYTRECVCSKIEDITPANIELLKQSCDSINSLANFV